MKLSKSEIEDLQEVKDLNKDYDFTIGVFDGINVNITQDKFYPDHVDITITKAFYHVKVFYMMKPNKVLKWFKKRENNFFENNGCFNRLV